MINVLVQNPKGGYTIVSTNRIDARPKVKFCGVNVLVIIEFTAMDKTYTNYVVVMPNVETANAVVKNAYETGRMNLLDYASVTFVNSNYFDEREEDAARTDILEKYPSLKR